MNKYPPWKYALILVALVVSLLYAAPNLFGEVPAVQVSGIRASTKVDAAMQSGLEAALKEAGIAPTLVELDEAALRFRFADPDTQLKARDVIQSKVGPGYVVALNLVSNTPRWLQAIGSKPMYLGLDLRGGVHFLLQVDMKAAAAKSQERFLGDLRVLMRDKKIYYSGARARRRPAGGEVPRPRDARRGAEGNRPRRCRTCSSRNRRSARTSS